MVLVNPVERDCNDIIKSSTIKMHKRLKGLFITHNYGLYGASQSLQLLLKNISDTDVTLVIPFKEILTTRKKREIAHLFSLKENQIKQFFLPWDNCFEGRRIDFFNVSVQRIKNILWKITKNWLYQEIETGEYDYIHLNSLALNNIIVERYPFILHTREFLIDSSKDKLKRISHSKGVIFIDESVQKPFEHYRLKSKIVLNNPVNMENVGRYCNIKSHFTRYTVISIIARIVDEKGIDFIIKSFKKASCDSLRLVIVGDKGGGFSTGYGNYCKEISAEDKRITFWGEEKNIGKIYGISDYIVRGEVDFRMGRSILEALYSDCDVIVPISNEQIVETNQELIKFKDKVHTYLPRNIDSLTKFFLSLAGRKIKKKNFRSNTDNYVKRFNEYIHNIL